MIFEVPLLARYFKQKAKDFDLDGNNGSKQSILRTVSSGRMIIVEAGARSMCDGLSRPDDEYFKQMNLPKVSSWSSPTKKQVKVDRWSRLKNTLKECENWISRTLLALNPLNLKGQFKKSNSFISDNNSKSAGDFTQRSGSLGRMDPDIINLD